MKPSTRKKVIILLFSVSTGGFVLSFFLFAACLYILFYTSFYIFGLILVAGVMAAGVAVSIATQKAPALYEKTLAPLLQRSENNDDCPAPNSSK